MNSALKLPAVLAVSMMLISTGCASLKDRADAAGARQGAAAARVTLPALPEDCRAQEAHASLVAGVEIRSVLRRERAALDRANSRVTRCADNYDAVAKALR